MTANFSFKKGLNAELIIKEIKNGRIIHDDGRVSLAFPQHSETLPLLLSALDSGEDVGHQMANRVVTRALFSNVLPKDFTAQDLSEACRRAYAQQLRRKTSRFIAYFTFTLDDDSPVNWMKAEAAASISIPRRAVGSLEGLIWSAGRPLNSRLFRAMRRRHPASTCQYWCILMATVPLMPITRPRTRWTRFGGC